LGTRRLRRGIPAARAECDCEDGSGDADGVSQEWRHASILVGGDEVATMALPYGAAVYPIATFIQNGQLPPS
jgi:hypothetical protein